MSSSAHDWSSGVLTDARELASLARERDDLLLLSEALVDVEAARTTDTRLSILKCAIQRLGFRRVDTAPRAEAAGLNEPSAMIGNSLITESGDLVVPLRSVDGTELATLVLGDSVESDVFAPSRVRMVELFAQQVASIIENARLFEESQRERGRGEALADIARAINGSLRLSEVLEIGLRHALELIGSEAASIGLLRGDYVVLIANAGAAAAENGLEIPLDGSVSGRAIRGRRPVVENDVGSILGYRQPSKYVTIERIVVAPLVSSSGPIGTLTAINRATPFTTDDGDVLQRLADQIVVAIANARLYEEVSETAERHRRAVEDERRARDVAAQSEERYARLVESAFDAIFTVDHDGRITSANQSLVHACGKSREQLLGSPAVELVDPRDRQLALQAFGDAMSGAPQRAQLRYPDWTGETATCSVTLTPLSEEAGKITGSICIVRDITEEVRITEQLVQQEKLAAVGELVSGVAHELNNPLASVMAFAQLLLNEREAGQTNREALEAIHHEAKRAAKIVANLLTFARQHQPERAATDLNRVVEDTLELRRYSLRNAQVNVVVRLDPAMPPTMADAFQLQQVVLNLLANAEHALSAWSGARVVTVSTEHDGERLTISVADTGPGIAPDHLSRVFNPFFTTKPVGEGTGLGLSISDGIVREHGGRIRVESTPGKGATFTIELPLAPPPVGGLSTVSANGSSEHISVSAKRLLVIDDEPGLRQALTMYFEARGHVMDSAANAAEGVELASCGEYDALLLDLRLPDADGDDVLRVLEKKGRAPRRIVFATGDPESAAARAVSSAGYPVIGKPFALNSVASMLLAPAG
jgi:two-component system NtrC family sensor kinase